MKKIITLSICVLLTVTLFACGNSEGVSQTDYNKLLDENKLLRERLEEFESSSIDVPEMPDTEDSTDIPDPVSSNAEIWEIHYYLDSFRQPTENSYIAALFDGVFSNSATSNSNLIARILVDSNDIAIILFEYGRTQVKNSSTRNSTTYNITMRTDDDKDIRIVGDMPAGSDRIYIPTDNKKDIINALSGTGEVSFYIVNAERTTTNYLFTATAANFADVYKDYN